MTSFLLFAGDHLWLHWALGLGCLGGATWLAFGPFFGVDGWGWRRTLAFAFLVFLTLGAFKYPGFSYPQWVNADEAVFLAEAQTYRDVPHALPWREIDGYSGGPLIPLQLLWTVPFGIPLDYAAGRITAAFDEGFFVLLIWFAARRAFGLRIAAMTALPFLLLFALNSHEYLVFYASEHPALPLYSAALALLAALLRGAGGWAAFGLGCVLGAVPFVKLQGTPLALFLGGTGLFLAWRGGGWKRALPALVGACVPSLLLLAPLVACGQFKAFWNEYVVWAFGYVGGEKSWVKRFAVGVEFFFDTRFPQAFLSIQTAALFLAFLVPAWKGWRAQQWGWFLWLAAFAGLSLFTVMVSGKNYYHYAFYLFPVLAACWAVLWKGMGRGTFTALGRAGWDGVAMAGVTGFVWIFALGLLKAKSWIPAFDLRIGMSFAFLVLSLLAAGVSWGRVSFSDRRRLLFLGFVLPLLTFSCYHGRYAGHMAEGAGLPRAPLAPTAKAMAQPGDRMAIWGWSPEIAVEAGLALGTRDPATDMAIVPSPVRDRYRARFLNDLRTNRPRFFVEAVGEGSWCFFDRAEMGIQAFPELASYVDLHYRLVTEDRDLRLYVRKTD